MKDLPSCSEAVALWKPRSSKEGNVRQLGEITKQATGCDMKVGQAKKAVWHIREGVSGKVPMTKHPFPNLPLLRNPHLFVFGLLGVAMTNCGRLDLMWVHDLITVGLN